MSSLSRQLTKLAQNPTVQRTVREGAAKVSQAAQKPENQRRIASIRAKLLGPSGPGIKRY